MRAIYIENFDSNSDPIIKGDSAHHLIKVLRVKIGADLLILDGNGSVSQVCIVQILKNELIFELISTKKEERKHLIDLAVGVTKKDALELILKISCELGINKIYLLETEFSQRIKINEDRLKKLMVSGIEQSNNPFLPVLEVIPFNRFDHSDYEQIYLCSTFSESDKEIKFSEGKKVIFIGPEGGFSEDEETMLKSKENISVIQLNTYILRSPTAVAATVGHVLGLGKA